MEKKTNEETILIFAPLFPPYQGGAAQHYSNLVESLPNTSIVLTACHPDRLFVDRNDKVTIFRVIPRHENIPDPLRAVAESLVGFLMSMYIILAYEVNIIHSHSTSFTSPGIGLSSLCTRTPVLYDCRDENFPELITQIGHTPLYFSAGKQVDKQLNSMEIPDEKIQRLPIVDPDYVTDYATRTEKGNNDFKVIYVGAFKQVRKLTELTEAFADFVDSHQDAKLQLIGDGKQRSKIEELVSENDIEDSVIISGALDHKTTLMKISGSNVLVHPSTKETGPRVVSEAMKIGTPVIATEVGYVPELISDGDNGIIIEGSRQSIIGALERLYKNKNLRSNIANKAQEQIRTHNWENVGEKLSKIYVQVCE